MLATRPYAYESPGRSWWHLLSTLAVLVGATFVALAAPWWPLRALGGLLMGLTMVRTFMPFHDIHHGAIFRTSPLARAIVNLYGLAILTPPRVWRETHNYHHAHTAKTEGQQRGTFTLFTTEQWREAGPAERLGYRIERHPLTFLCGYVTVFLVSFGVVPFFRNPRRYWDSGLSLLVHASIGFAMLALGGPAALFFAFLLPFTIMGAMGAYLFYTQHTFDGMHVPAKASWNHTRASLEASSYLKLGRVMQWFTGNIGFHHVHHLNPRIPFYRLPAAMAAIPELRDPITVTLSPRTILSSFRLNLWDEDKGRMVSYRAARGR